MVKPVLEDKAVAGQDASSVIASLPFNSDPCAFRNGVFLGSGVRVAGSNVLVGLFSSSSEGIDGLCGADRKLLVGIIDVVATFGVVKDVLLSSRCSFAAL